MTRHPEREIVSGLTQRGETVAVAESLTGGLVTAAIVSVPGASLILQGGVVAYHKSVKSHVLGVNADLLARQGAVSERVVREMAEGVRGALEGYPQASWGLATTGVAGPDPDPDTGAPPGEVWIGVSGPHGTTTRHVVIAGDREAIRREATRLALEALAEEVLLLRE